MASLLILNVALFVAAAVAGSVAAWFGWRLAGRDDGDGADGGGGARRGPLPWPGWPSPVAPRRSAPGGDLARSA